MFSALKKLGASSSRPPDGVVVAGTTPMSGSLQKKFARGVQYNMKIIIKGDRNVGKSCLLERLQAKAFIEAYTPSDEITVASIQWSFKATEDVVKVEVWDVVDRGKARTQQSGLKLSLGGTGGSASGPTPALDAEFLDVYKGTHGVVLMLDITKSWTFEYVCKELPKIPQDIPVLILGNHCDMAHHRVVSQGQVLGLIEGFADRPAEILYGESSMRNGFGLRLLHKFLGLPFLRLQKETLLSQLQRNQRETQSCSVELSDFLKSDDAAYNKFLDTLSNRRRQIADANPKSLAPSVLPHSASGSSLASNSSSSNYASPSSSSNNNNSNELRATKSIIIGAGQPIVIPGQTNITNDPKLRQQMIGQAAANVVPAVVVPQPPAPIPAKQPATGFMASLFGAAKSEIQEAIPVAQLSRVSIAEHKVISVDEFCPEGGAGLDRSFLDDEPSQTSGSGRQPIGADDSDSDEEAGNPMVARFHDEPSELDSSSPKHLPKSSIHSPGSTTAQPKVNPLAKTRSKSAAQLQTDPVTSMRLDYFVERKSSLSSDDIEVPTVLDTNIEPVDNFDSWLSSDEMTSRRRSPEGGEDVSAMVGAQPEPITGRTDSVDEEKPEKRHKSKSKKERKETKEERDERRERKKKRKSKSDLEQFLSGTPSSTIDQADAAYEAI